MNKPDDNYIGMILEQILDEIQAVHELVADHPNRTEFFELRDDVKDLKAEVTTTKAAVKDLSRDVSELKTGVQVLKDDVKVLKTDVSELKTDVKVLKDDVKVLKTDVSELKTDMKVVKAAVTDYDGRITRLERRAA